MPGNAGFVFIATILDFLPPPVSMRPGDGKAKAKQENNLRTCVSVGKQRMVKTEEAQTVWCCALYHYVSSVHSLPKNYGSLRIPLVNHRAEGWAIAPGLEPCEGSEVSLNALADLAKKETFHKKKTMDSGNRGRNFSKTGCLQLSAALESRRFVQQFSGRFRC